VVDTDTSINVEATMLQLILRELVQADRDREVVEDLRDRQRLALQPRRESRPITVADSPSYVARRIPARVRGTGA